MRRVFLFLSIIQLFGCVEPPEYMIPELEFESDKIIPNSDIRTVMSAYDQSGEELHIFDAEDKSIISCFVISSDEAGNFYKTLVVQDLPENPTKGLEIKIDMRSYYTKYNFGRKLYIRLSGLAMMYINGKYILGYAIGTDLGDIPNSLLDETILRSEETAEIIPQDLSLENYTNDMINRFIRLKSVQFLKTELGKSFSSEVYDRYNGERIIEQCENKAKTTLFTSSYASFGSYLLPTERFEISAVLSADTYSEKIHLALNNPEYLITNDLQRCDPIVFSCPEVLIRDERSVLFHEDFEDFKSTSDIEQHGWMNFNANYGNGKFKKRSRKENNFLQISAYDSNEYVMDVWLISPKIEFSVKNQIYLTFKTRATFEEGTVLSVWYSPDFDGNFNEANWYEMNADISVGSADGGNEFFLDSGPVSMTCLTEKIHVAFRYLGADPGISTTYDIDNVLVFEQTRID